MTDWEPQPTVADADEVRRRHAENRQAWNQGASAYSEVRDEAIAFLRAGRSNLHPVERANLGDLRSWCSTAIHLQCASGRDTLSLWNGGVPHVVGIDISDVHIENARRMSNALGAPAEWYRCDVLDSPHSLDGTADLVYTGRGALNWLHDIEAWAQVVARLLKPGGIVHVFETHPVSWLFSPDAPSLQVEPGFAYFETAGASRGWPETYIGDLGMEQERHAVKYERLWPLGSIVMAVLHAGLTLEHLSEHPDTYWDAFPNLPASEQRRIPQTFSLMARRSTG